MTTMNSNHSSKLLTLLLAATLVVSAVGPAAAVSTEAEDAPATAEVGSQVETTFTLSELYTEYEQWTLHGETNLTGVTWTVRTFDQAGNRVSQTSYDGQSFNHSISLSNDVDEVELVLEGTVPEVSNFTYDPASAQAITLADLNQVRTGGASDDVDSWQVRPYTQESKSAREAIDAASDAVETAREDGVDVSGAQNTLDNAISAFDSGNFELASDLASEAETSADDSVEQAEQSSQRTQLLLYGGIGVVVAALVAGGIIWYRGQQDDYDKLR